MDFASNWRCLPADGARDVDRRPYWGSRCRSRWLTAAGSGWAGFAIAALGAGLASFGGQPILLIAGLAIASAGIGAIFVSAGITGLSNVEQANAGTVSALLNTAHEVGGAVAVSVLSVFAGGGVGGGFMGLAATSLVAAVAMIALVPSVKPASDATSFMH